MIWKTINALGKEVTWYSEDNLKELLKLKETIGKIKEIAIKSNQAPCLDPYCDCTKCKDEITNCGNNCMEKGLKEILQITNEVKHDPN